VSRVVHLKSIVRVQEPLYLGDIDLYLLTIEIISQLIQQIFRVAKFLALGLVEWQDSHDFLLVLVHYFILSKL
jgi:hypothetical protein